jgi:two-component system, OmpR family, sensor histidine kinase MprB
MAHTAPSGRAVTGRARQLGAHVLREVVPRRGMPLRRRVSMAAAAAVAIAVALAVVVCYIAVSYRLSSELHGQLKAEANTDINRVHSVGGSLPTYNASKGGSSPYRSVVLTNGVSGIPNGSASIPLTKRAIAVARGSQSAGFQDITIGTTDVCVYMVRTAVSLEGGQTVSAALELGRPLTQSNSLLHELRLILLVVFLFAVPLAALFGRFAARRVLRPLSEVTQTADTIARTDDLTQRIAVHEDDEVGQLASRFNAMLERLGASRQELDESVRSQRQLVADASHELRTPVTSLRTNVEVLLASPDLDEGDRALLGDVLEQSEELSTLVADLIEVARGELPSDALEDVRLDGLVEDALVRARRNSPHTEFRAQLIPAVIQGSPELLARAVNNLLDNAVKHGGGGPVEVQVDRTGLTVRDHGAGIDPSDLPHIFDRFYRGVDSRSTQGSGLGLAIVAQTAQLHGGVARAANAPDGGAIFTLELATAPLATSGDLTSDILDADTTAPHGGERPGALWS